MKNSNYETMLETSRICHAGQTQRLTLIFNLIALVSSDSAFMLGSAEEARLYEGVGTSESAFLFKLPSPEPLVPKAKSNRTSCTKSGHKETKL